MQIRPDYEQYASMMRQHLATGTDLETDARFVDMLVARHAEILDVGCGHGSAVNALRRSGHLAFGIDPTPVVLKIATDRFPPAWFRDLGAEQVSPETLREAGLPAAYDLVLMAGNLPAFLADAARAAVLAQIVAVLKPGGFLVVGTTVHAPGGPQDLDGAAAAAGLLLKQRFADWHLTRYRDDSRWSVSVFQASGAAAAAPGPDGIFILS